MHETCKPYIPIRHDPLIFLKASPTSGGAGGGGGGGMVCCLLGKKQSLGLGWMNLLYSYTFVYACFPTSEEITTETSLVSCTYVDTRSFIKIINKSAWSSSFFHAWMWIWVASFLPLAYTYAVQAKTYEMKSPASILFGLCLCLIHFRNPRTNCSTKLEKRLWLQYLLYKT